MKEYKVVTTKDLLNFQESVNNALAEGWELQGGVSLGMAYDPANWAHIRFHFAQAMTREVAADEK